MFETSFTYASATPLPSNISLEGALEVLHDFDAVMKLNPDCHSVKQITPPKKQTKPDEPIAEGEQMTYWTVGDDLPFMPKKLWSGGVKYNAEFLPMQDGCDIIVHAPGGFTSTNHWRILRQTAPLEHSMNKPQQGEEHNEVLETLPEDELSAALERVGIKDLLHAETTSSGAGWYVEIISDAKCPRTFVSIIKGFLRNSHSQLQHAFIDQLEATAMAAPSEAQDQTQKPSQRPVATRRPTLGRRRSSVL